MARIYFESDSIEERLHELGLEEDRLVEIVQRGYVAFASCTANDPPLYPGFSAWATMVRGLREYLLPKWERSDENNYSLVINAAGTVAIAVATGDENTGLRGTSPATKSSKGPPSTSGAVASNQSQLTLPFNFPPLAIPKRIAADGERRMTWILLVHRAQDEVRCELSLPTSMRNDGRVDGWQERIILKSVPTDPDTLVIMPSQPNQPDIDVAVKRRA